MYYWAIFADEPGQPLQDIMLWFGTAESARNAKKAADLLKTKVLIVKLGHADLPEMTIF